MRYNTMGHSKQNQGSETNRLPRYTMVDSDSLADHLTLLVKEVEQTFINLAVTDFTVRECLALAIQLYRIERG